MNRQQRRRSVVRVKVRANGTQASVQAQNAGVLRLKSTGRVLGDDSEKPAQEQGPDGRFMPAGWSAEFVGPLPMTRQQRRAVLRMQLKHARVAARAWDQVTGGDGVTLLDGQPVPVGGNS